MINPKQVLNVSTTPAGVYICILYGEEVVNATARSPACTNCTMSEPYACTYALNAKLKIDTICSHYFHTEIFYWRPFTVIEMQQKSAETTGDHPQGSQPTKTTQMGNGRYIICEVPY